MKGPIPQIEVQNLDPYCEKYHKLFQQCMLIHEGENNWIDEQNSLSNPGMHASIENPDKQLKPEKTTPLIQCKSELYNFINCVESLRRGIERVNWIGCLKERQRVEICSSEWCPGPDCNHECQFVRDKKDACIQTQIKKYIK